MKTYIIYLNNTQIGIASADNEVYALMDFLEENIEYQDTPLSHFTTFQVNI